jgi:tetratricopeptide (TPR) repeat protein
MKKILLIISILLVANGSLAAGSSSSDNGDTASLYKSGKKLVYRAKKLEKKDKLEKALKLYSKATEKLLKAHKKEKKNPDILNYLGYSLRKIGEFKEAEIYYLKGLELDSGHLGINEYLGELYVQTDRIDLAMGRLATLKGCGCEEYDELKELIEKNK